MSNLRCKSLVVTPFALTALLLSLISPGTRAQDTGAVNVQAVNIKVHVDQPEGALAPIWNYFGYDEPNYTYAPNGKKLLGELAGHTLDQPSADLRQFAAELELGDVFS